jgi:hypothetical protein
MALLLAVLRAAAWAGCTKRPAKLVKQKRESFGSPFFVAGSGLKQMEHALHLRGYNHLTRNKDVKACVQS